MQTFRLLVLANNIDWASLSAKMDAVKTFYAPVCNLEISIQQISVTPVYTLYPELEPLYVIDRDWYDQHFAAPAALLADIVLFITKPGYQTPTYMGYMSYNNVGPWETTVFVLGGENDHTYVNEKDFGDSFTLLACHELSHVFYAVMHLADATHLHFPSTDPHTDNTPTNVLKDFNFQTPNAILEWLKDQLVSALTALKIIQKSPIAIITDPTSPSVAS
jgi:hypothetical protein